MKTQDQSSTVAADENLVRLNKYLAGHGVASRRRCDELIEARKITVDGLITTELGTKVDPTRQVIEIDGYVLKPEGLIRRYYLLNKPSGVLCTNEPRELRPRAVDLITDRKKGRIYTVGRLDEETIGLVILTSDGDFANKVMHPRYGVSKTYLVNVQGRIDDESLMHIREGVRLSEGKTGGARVVVQKRGARQSTLIVTLREGKNREVRRVFARLGWRVTSLRRTNIGNINDRGLKVGHWRELTRLEVRELVEHADAPESQTFSPRQSRWRSNGGNSSSSNGRRSEGDATRSSCRRSARSH